MSEIVEFLSLTLLLTVAFPGGQHAVQIEISAAQTRIENRYFGRIFSAFCYCVAQEVNIFGNFSIIEILCYSPRIGGCLNFKIVYTDIKNFYYFIKS